MVNSSLNWLLVSRYLWTVFMVLIIFLIYVLRSWCTVFGRITRLSMLDQRFFWSLYISFEGTHSLASLVEMSAYERQESNGWADQWDKHFDEDVGGPGRKRSKMAKVKAAATNSVERTKSAATVSAQIVKSGTSTSLRWIKDKVQRKKWNLLNYLDIL